MTRRIVVTGANGFIGSAVVANHVLAGDDVVGVVRRPPTNPVGGVRYEVVDFADPNEFGRLLRSHTPELVIHMAGFPSAATDLGTARRVIADDFVPAMSVILSCAEVGGARLLLTASLEEAVPDHRALSLYGWAKSSVFDAAMVIADRHDLEIVRARIFMGYGPTQAPQKLIPTIVRTVKENVPFQTASGSRLLDWIYISDIASGIHAIGETPALHGKTLDLGTGVLTSIADVVVTAQRIGSGASVEPPEDSNDLSWGASGRRADTSTTTELTGWSSSVDLEAGLRMMFA